MPFSQILAIYFALEVADCFNCSPDNTPDFDEVQQCCDSPTIIQTEIVNECQIAGASVLEWAQCYFKNIDAITDGKPNPGSLKALAKSSLAEYPDWKYKFDMVIDNCTDEVLAKDADTKKRLSRPPYNMRNVSSIYAHLIACIDTSLWLECPEAKRDNSSKCDEIEDYMVECLNDFPPPHFTLFI